MQVLTLAEANNNMKTIFDNVFYNNDEVIIHRKEQENVVVIPFEEYNSMKETSYLLGSANNKKNLLDSLKNARTGNTMEKELVK